MDVSMARHFSIRPELIYSKLNISWGANVSYSAPPSFSYSDVIMERRSYLTVPINFVGNYEIGPGKFQVTLGPYFSLGLGGGRYQETYTSSSSSSTYKVEFDARLIAGKVPSTYSSVLHYYNPLDLGINFGLGYQLSRILISGQFLAGLTNTQPHYESNYLESSRKDLITRNRSFSLGAAYRIGKIKRLN